MLGVPILKHFRVSLIYSVSIILQIDEIPELFLTAVSLSHDKTGAQHLHIARDDDNNTFRLV